MKAKLILAIGGYLLCAPSFGQNQNPSQNPKLQALEKAAKEAANCPINFWGKVVDQDGTPISGATANITLANGSFGEDGDDPKIIVLSDANGLFSLTGKKGGGISVWVSKDGFYSVPDAVSASLDYFQKLKFPQASFNRGGTWQPFPTEQQPTIFTLTKKGPPAANLIYKRIRIPMLKDGTPVNIDLALGRAVPVGQGDLQVESWVTDNGADVIHPFPWKCRVTVLNGGLKYRSGDLDFQAPTSGYRGEDEVDMPITVPRWNKSMLKQYFLQISGNRYVRMRFWMVSGGNNFLNLEYFLNPVAGDQNLESAKYTPFDDVKIQ